MPTKAEFQTGIEELKEDLEGKTVQGRALRDILDRVGQAAQARFLYSTIKSGDLRSFQDFTEHFVDDGTIPGRINPRHISLVVKSGDQICSYSLPLTDARGAIIHAIIFPYSVNDNYYLRLNDHKSENSEVLRFSANSISVCRNSTTKRLKYDKGVLVSLVCLGCFVDVYANGQIISRSRRQQPIDPASVSITMLGEHGPDLEARLLGMEVWALDGPAEASLPGLLADEEEGLRETMASLLDQGKVLDFYHLLCNIEDIDLTLLREKCLDVLEGLVGGHERGVRTWLMDKIASRLPQEDQERWARRKAVLMPVPAIEVTNLVVRFARDPSRMLSFRRLLTGKRLEYFFPLRNLNFSIYPGDILGIIGPNGAGKSTLLQVLCGLVPIQAGKVLVKGKFILMKPGMGLRTQLTGRENIYHVGVYMGLSGKKLDAIADEVVEFSELGPDIDKPIKYYSDGMLSRLVFSVATSIKPEILLLDELLGAGDLGFRDKAAQRLDQFMKEAKVIIVVTHGLGYVREKCNKALYIPKHGPWFFGDPDLAIARYMDDLHLEKVPFERLNLMRDEEQLLPGQLMGIAGESF